MRKLKQRLRALVHDLHYLRQIWSTLRGVHPRHCNICGYRGRFRAHGIPPRQDAHCPSCHALERHRHQALWIRNNEDALRGKRILHFAPEGALRKLYRALAATYASANIVPGKADLVLNIERIDQPDDAWDVVVANHVLEHVDDRKALAEIRRILSPGGLAIFSFPLATGFAETYENPAIVAPRERALHFGQWDHVRFYGMDAAARIAAAGFAVTTYSAHEPEVHRHGINRNAVEFVARKT